MKIENIDVNEMERQRYNHIKNTGEYLELNVLVGTELLEMEDGIKANVPVVTTELHCCGPNEVACLHSVLIGIINSLEEKYPMECMMSKFTMEARDMGQVDIDLLNEEE